jgi:hypothetical protein
MDMIRLKALRELHGRQKRCKCISKGGCGKLLRLEAFKHGTSINRHGAKRYTIVNWCMECDAARARIRTAAASAKLRDELACDREAEAAVRAMPTNSLKLMLPMDREFFCELKPTEIGERVSRYTLVSQD